VLALAPPPAPVSAPRAHVATVPVLAPAPVAAPVQGSLRLAIERTHRGRPAFAVAGERILVLGSVTPFVAGQRVTVTFYRSGRRVLSRRVAVLPGASSRASGRFRIAYSSALPGTVGVAAVHAATAQMLTFAAPPARVRFYSADLAAGARGPAVRALQDGLALLHYEVPVGGVFDEATGRAVVAFRKLTGLARVPAADASVFRRLQQGAGAFHVRYPHDGRHVEADLDRQVLAEIEAGGRVRRIFTMSSGKPSTPTVVGRFRVYSKTPGVNAKGMVDSNYFIRGYAIHGYAEVPVYAASHGCLRVPIPDAAAIYAWVQLGTPVDVYFEGGGGSRSVRGNAGP
jgi:peptidoglycan hydrolase-like protein with peptidoglycan-binding domain